MRLLAEIAATEIPNGVWRGRRLGDLLLEGEDGERWLRWATRRHPDRELRAAAYTLLLHLDREIVAVPCLRIDLPLEGPVEMRIVGASDEGAEERLLRWVADDRRRRLLVALAVDLADVLPGESGS